MQQAQAPTWEAEDAIGALVVRASDDDLFEMVSRRSRPDPAGARPVGSAAVHGARRLGAARVRRGDRAREVRRPGVPLRGVRDPPRRSLRRATGSERGRREDGAGAGPDVRLARRAAGRCRGDTPREGPLKGKPALRARLREAEDYLAAMRMLVPIEVGCPVEVWAGARDDAALRALAEEHGLRGSWSGCWQRSTAPPRRRSPGARRAGAGYADRVQVVPVACDASGGRM